MEFKMGMIIAPRNCTLEELRQVWHLADSSGFHRVSTSDHLREPRWDTGSCYEATAILTLLAAQTTNVRVGSRVFCIGYRNPAVLAQSAAAIDHASKGRLELGLGAGWYELEHLAFGMAFPPIRTRMEMLEEGVQIISSMLNQGETTFTGKHYRVDKAACSPRPVQKKVPIWIGGIGERHTLRIAASYADGWAGPDMVPAVYQHKLQVLDRWCEKAGRDPSEIERVPSLGFYMGTDSADAIKKRGFFSDQWRRRDTRSGLFGTPSEVVDLIGEYSNVGAHGLTLDLKAPFDLDALQAFVEEVMPAFA